MKQIVKEIFHMSTTHTFFHLGPEQPQELFFIKYFIKLVTLHPSSNVLFCFQYRGQGEMRKIVIKLDLGLNWFTIAFVM